MKKYEHQFLIGFTGDPVGTNYVVTIYSDDKIIAKSELVKELSKMRHGEITFSISSQLIFLNQ